MAKGFDMANDFRNDTNPVNSRPTASVYDEAMLQSASPHYTGKHEAAVKLEAAERFIQWLSDHGPQEASDLAQAFLLGSGKPIHDLFSEEDPL